MTSSSTSISTITAAILGLLSILPPNADAQAENGDWHINGLDAPARLREAYYDAGGDMLRTSEDSSDFAKVGEQLVDIYFPDITKFTSAGINLNNNTITGAFPGTYSIGSLGKVSLSVDGEALNGYLNTTADTMILPNGGIDSLSLNVLTRLPAELSTADLAGTWKLIATDLPDDLTESYYNAFNDTSRQAKASSNNAEVGEQLVDTYFHSNPEQQVLTINIDAAGNITGDAAGAATANPDRSVTLNVGNVLTFHPNAAVDVMTHASQDNVAELLTKVIAVKLPTTADTTDLQGVWRAQSLDFPSYLTEAYYDSESEQSRTSTGPADSAQPGEQLVDVYFINPPELRTELITISGSGGVVGSTSGAIAASGSFFVFTPSAAGDPPTNFYSNASGTVMIAQDSKNEAVNLVTLVKVAGTEPSFEELVDLKVTLQPGGGLNFQWNPASSFQLMQAPDLSSAWQGIPESAGSSSYTADTSQASSMFYRIEVVKPE